MGINCRGALFPGSRALGREDVFWHRRVMECVQVADFLVASPGIRLGNIVLR